MLSPDAARRTHIPSSTRQAILVAHTHWDRAWYLPFEQFRIRLVRLVDRLLDILAIDDDFRCFMLDGQMIVIEDYLQVRPERRDDIAQLVHQSRLQIGPWYVLPDEFLVSPEALVRNLELGLRMAEELGGAMQVGYEPDAFGHIAQLPQILSGFGIDNVVFWRGMGDEVETLGSEFWWLAPDGTPALAAFLPASYSSFNLLGYPHSGDDINAPFRMEWAVEKLERGIEILDRFANARCLLLLSGNDHAEANRRLPEIVAEANRHFAGVDIRIGSLAEYLSCVRENATDFPYYRGELRSGAVSNVLQQVYSARMYLKQRNNLCETKLERYAEPFSGYAGFLGASSNHAFLDLAWRELLKNHPHDDICGCGVDATHREMVARFERVEQIADVLVRDSLRFLTDRITVPDDDRLPLFVFNPNGRSFRGTLLGMLAFAPGHHDVDAFSITDECGARVAHQEIDRRMEVAMEVNLPRRTLFVDVALSLPEIPSCGYRTLFLSKEDQEPETDLRVSDNAMQNGRLQVTFLPDGTITLDDLDNRVTFESLHTLEDIEDAGDEYTCAPARESRRFTNADAAVETECLAGGPVRAGYRIRCRWKLPAALAPDRARRSDETVDYVVTTDVWLGAGERRLDFVTSVENTARDHRLRVLFPTPFKTDVVHVDGHFDVLERPVAVPVGSHWVEPPSPTAHQRTFVDVSDGTAGLAVFNRGLPEYEAMERDEGVAIALTLLRCVGWLSRSDLSTRPGAAGYELATPEAQCPGTHEFHYALQPHSGGWETVIHDASAYNAPCTLLTGRTSEGLLPSDAEEPPAIEWEPLPRSEELDLLPRSASFLTLEPAELMLSSVRQDRDRETLTIRCYNPTSRAVPGRLKLLWPVQSATRVDLRGEKQDELPVHEGEVRFEARPKGIISIQCRLDLKEAVPHSLPE